MQVIYGIATSTEIAYYTYIYARVNPNLFQKVTSFTRVALLLGRFLSGILAQIFVSAGIMDFRQLNFLTLVSVSMATFVAMALPSVGRTQYFNREDETKLEKDVEFRGTILAKFGDRFKMSFHFTRHVQE